MEGLNAEVRLRVRLMSDMICDSYPRVLLARIDFFPLPTANAVLTCVFRFPLITKYSHVVHALVFGTHLAFGMRAVLYYLFISSAEDVSGHQVRFEQGLFEGYPGCT